MELGCANWELPAAAAGLLTTPAVAPFNVLCGLLRHPAWAFGLTGIAVRAISLPPLSRTTKGIVEGEFDGTVNLVNPSLEGVFVSATSTTRPFNSSWFLAVSSELFPAGAVSTVPEIVSPAD